MPPVFLRFFRVSIVFFLFMVSFLNVAIAATEDPTQKQPPQYWQTVGYGYALEVINDKLTFYDITKDGCIRNQWITSDHEGTPASQWILQKSGGAAEIDWFALHPVQLIALQALPASCQPEGTVDTDPIKNFEVFWDTYADHFPYSKKQNWDWQQRYPVWRSMVNPQTTDKELADIFSHIINQIRDGHAVLKDSDGEHIGDIDTRLLAYEYRLRQGWKKDDDYRYFWPFKRDKLRKWKQIIVERYLLPSPTQEDDLQESELQAGDLQQQRTALQALHSYYDNFHFGVLRNNFSYLRIDSMGWFTEDNNYENWLLAVGDVMQTLLPDIHKTNGLIIDLRSNGGGTDVVSLKLLSYLVSANTRIGAKATMEKGQLGVAKDIWLASSTANNYQGPIVALTSQGTASAAEIMLMGLIARGNTTLIGEPSNGSFSDILPKHLPNGWTFGLSNQIYLDVNGVDHEEVGIPVSEYIPFLDLTELDKGQDLALEKAMSILSNPK